MPMEAAEWLKDSSEVGLMNRLIEEGGDGGWVGILETQGALEIHKMLEKQGGAGETG